MSDLAKVSKTFCFWQWKVLETFQAYRFQRGGLKQYTLRNVGMNAWGGDYSMKIRVGGAAGVPKSWLLLYLASRQKLDPSIYQLGTRVWKSVPVFIPEFENLYLSLYLIAEIETHPYTWAQKLRPIWAAPPYETFLGSDPRAWMVNRCGHWCADQQEGLILCQCLWIGSNKKQTKFCHPRNSKFIPQDVSKSDLKYTK